MTPREVLRKADAEIERAERLLKIAQVARVWNVSERTVWRDIKEGRVRAVVTESGRTRIPVSALSTRPRANPLPQQLPRCGVYLVAGPALVKIGKATDVSRRFTGLATGSPVSLKFIGWVQTEDDRAARKLEGLLHERFAALRAHGEWFRMTDEDAAGVVREYGGSFHRSECDKARHASALSASIETDSASS